VQVLDDAVIVSARLHAVPLMTNPFERSGNQRATTPRLIYDIFSRLLLPARFFRLTFQFRSVHTVSALA
jgi:hypothetical protein